MHTHASYGAAAPAAAPGARAWVVQRCSCWYWTRTAGWRRVGPTGGDSGRSASGKGNLGVGTVSDQLRPVLSPLACTRTLNNLSISSSSDLGVDPGDEVREV